MLHYKEISFSIEDLTVDGVPCKVCTRTVLDGLRGLDGVVAVRVAPIDDPHGIGLGVATVKFNPEFVELGRLRRTLEVDLGFAVHEVHEEAHPIHR